MKLKLFAPELAEILLIVMQEPLLLVDPLYKAPHVIGHRVQVELTVKAELFPFVYGDLRESSAALQRLDAQQGPYR